MNVLPLIVPTFDRIWSPIPGNSARAEATTRSCREEALLGDAGRDRAASVVSELAEDGERERRRAMPLLLGINVVRESS